MTHKIFLVGVFSEKMHSVGDHAQTLALTRFFHRHYSDYQLVMVSRDDPKLMKKLKHVYAGDKVFLSSSGDFGSFHYDNGWHVKRRRIIELLRHVRVVQLPVSVYYEDNGFGYSVFESDKSFYTFHPNLLLLCRSHVESRLLQQNFGCRVAWYPDFVYNLKPPVIDNSTREGVLVVLRGDKESKQLAGKVGHKKPSYFEMFVKRRLVNFGLLEKPESLREQTKRVLTGFGDVTIKDLQVSNKDLTGDNREKIVYEVLREYGKYRVVVTDRFHAAVFAWLTSTPCVALQTGIPHKISGNNCLMPNVVCCDNIKNLKEKVTEALKLQPEHVDYTKMFNGFRRFVDRKFDTPVKDDVKRNVDVLDVIFNRRSVRTWLPYSVEKEKVDLLVNAGYAAPSAANEQAVNIRAVTDPETLKFLKTMTSPWFNVPPLALVYSYDMRGGYTLKLNFDSWHYRFVWQDTACAAMNTLLAAETLGLKACWASVNPNCEQQVATRLGFWQGEKLACMIFAGYSNQKTSLNSLHQGKPIKRIKHA
ncbi:MAG: nitroreductase family protein [Candidatus Aminicenantes bacterium]